MKTRRSESAYRTVISTTYPSLQRALMAGLSPLVLYVRRPAQRPDGWLPYFVRGDPRRRHAAAAGEIATP